MSGSELIPDKYYLQPELFRTIVTHTPLVSIDLLIRNPAGELLLGWRSNRPARDCWFVPGGRINKNESITAAFKRLTRAELGVELAVDSARFCGVFEHFYPDCFAGAVTSTHYVVLAYELELAGLPELPREQHSSYCWLAPASLLADPQVHENVKAYFR